MQTVLNVLTVGSRAPAPPREDRQGEGDDRRVHRPQPGELALVSAHAARGQLGPTLLPENLASLVTAASLAARVSIRASALFLEALLEGARYSSLTGMGITRRALVTAVSSAKALHYMQDRMGWSNKDGKDDAFLGVLEKYSSVGVYVIHSTFSLAELFAMSGFSLTADVLSAGTGAAEESVRAFDSIFGSNESSRALASIVMMVRRELLQDASFPLAEKGIIGGLAALTKALTAFACLQIATHRRTQEMQRLRVIYDCTVLLERERIDYGPSHTSYRPQEIPPSTTPPPRLSSLQTAATESKRMSHHSFTRHQDDVSPEIGRLRTPLTAGRLHCRVQSDDLDIGSVRSFLEDEKRNSISMPTSALRTNRHSRTSLQSDQSISDISEAEVEEDIAHDLGLLLGSDEIDVDYAGAGEMTDDIKTAIDGIVSGEASLPSAFELVGEQDGPHGSHIDLVRSRNTDQVFEIETTTTTTETRTVVRIGGPGNADERIVARRTRPPGSARHLAASRDSTSRVVRGTFVTPGSRGPQRHTVEATLEEEEAEWMEISEMVSPALAGETLSIVPSSLNGSPSIGSLSRVETVEHPDQGRQRLNAVLKTMTQRFTRRKRVIKRVTNEDDENETRRPSHGRRTSGSHKSPQIEWEASPPNSPSPSPKKSGPVRRIMSAANLKKPRSRQRNVNDLHSTSSSAMSSETELPSPPQPTVDTFKERRRPEAYTGVGGGRVVRRKSAASLKSIHTTRTHVETAATALDDEIPADSNFPCAHLVANLRRFIRYSSAAYGQAFMRILGIGTVAFNFPSTEHHANVHAFCHHTGLPLDSVILTSFTEPAAFLSSSATPLVHYVSVDHQAKAIVLTCRGTLGLSDILTDLTAEYDEVSLPHDPNNKAYYAHSGMLYGAKSLLKESSTVFACLKRALTDWPDYGLVLCGHSLGGGVAALLSILLASPRAAYELELSRRNAEEIVGQQRASTRVTPFVTSFSSGLPPGRPVHCYVFGPPCVASAELADYSTGLVTCLVHNTDVVPSLSLGMFRDLKNVAATLWEEPQLAEEIIGRVVGLYQAGRKAKMVGTIASSSGVVATTTGDMRIPLESPIEISLTPDEMSEGRTSNRALARDYQDPALIPLAIDEDPQSSPEQPLASCEQPETDLYATIKTIRAGNDADKLYPPGNVYLVEWHTVFVAEQDPSHDLSRAPGPSRIKTSRQEGRRVILRKVEDVTLRFSEPIFSKSMFSDHSPSCYERAVDVLAQAVLPQ